MTPLAARGPSPVAGRELLPARAPRRLEARRLLHVSPGEATVSDHALRDLPRLLAPGDLLVVNDVATLPASLPLSRRDAELRLAAWEPDGTFRAVVFGAGDFRTPTELRGKAPRLSPGERVASGDLEAQILEVDPEEPRLVRVAFACSGAELLAALYRNGRVVQYSYLERPLELWDVQSRFASRPWAFEAPSAGLPLTFALLEAARRRGVELAWVSHAAGLSSTGSASLDRRLPLPERYEIPSGTAEAIARARGLGRRVVAVGTTVVRALESSAAEHGAVRAGAGEARLVLGPGFRPRAVSGLLSGMHDEASSHFALLGAFAPRALLARAHEHALRSGYLQHEFGDSCLVL